MDTASAPPEIPEEASAAIHAGGEERRLVGGTLAVQGARVAYVLSVLVVATALGRTLTLTEFGVYGLVLSISGYVLFMQGAVETGAIRELAAAGSEEERNRAFTTAVLTYGVIGLLAAVVIVMLGITLLGVFDIPPELESQA